MTHPHHNETASCACSHHEHHEHHHEHHEHHEHHHEHHEHHHEHEEGGLRRQLTIIITATLTLIAAALIEHYGHLATWQLLLVYLVPYLLAGHETLQEAAEGLAHGDAFNEHLLMAIATIGALAIGFLPGGEPQFAEAVFVMLFFQVGELFEGYAEGQSRRSIAHLMEIRPDKAVVEEHHEDGIATTTIPAEEVMPGMTVVVSPGERIPVDGTVVEGSSSLNTVALTGESMPRQVAAGDDVASGCINLDGVLRIRATRRYEESTVAKIISMVESAADHKSKSEAFITRFARIYTPIVVLAAVAIAIIPVIAGGAFVTWFYRALLFLVVSCPCALVISVPLTFFGGLGGASRKGILIKGANFMDALAKMDTVVFDKTGTLTEGQFAVSAVHPEAWGGGADTAAAEHRLLHLAAHVEHYSTHPIGAALRAAFPEEATDGCTVSDVQEIAGQGIRARVGDEIVCVGNTRMMEAVGADWHDCHLVGTVIHVAIAPATSADQFVYAGHIVISDQVKDDSREAIAALRECEVRKIVMLTGDREEVARQVAEELQIDRYHAGLLPADKVAHLEEHLQTLPAGGTLAFVGDGINDAPVLARADIGIAMGALGSDAAIDAADVVLMDDHPSKIATAIRVARHTIGIARQNVAFAIGVKVAVLVLAVFGMATMWMAVFADVGVTVLAVLNAIRALK